MGRRPDNPEIQAAKGFPGRRRSKVEKQIDKAEALAAQLAAAPAENGMRLAPPAFLTDPRLAPALSVWRDLGPELERLNLLHALDRYTFATFCYWAGEYFACLRDILDNGATYKSPTIAGGTLERKRPVVQQRDLAEGRMMALADQFGLTPLARNRLIAQQAAIGPSGGLFERAPPAAPAPEAAAPAAADGAIGLLGRFDSAPPARAN